MDQTKFNKLKSYITARYIFEQMLYRDLITGKEFQKADAQLADFYGFPPNSIFRFRIIPTGKPNQPKKETEGSDKSI